MIVNAFETYRVGDIAIFAEGFEFILLKLGHVVYFEVSLCQVIAPVALIVADVRGVLTLEGADAAFHF